MYFCFEFCNMSIIQPRGKWASVWLCKYFLCCFLSFVKQSVSLFLLKPQDDDDHDLIFHCYYCSARYYLMCFHFPTHSLQRLLCIRSKFVTTTTTRLYKKKPLERRSTDQHYWLSINFTRNRDQQNSLNVLQEDKI